MSISINNLTKSFDDKIILDNLSLEIPTGHLIGLIGENGVGKTTMIRCIMNIDPEYTGRISFGRKSNTIPETFNHVALLHENDALYPQMTAYDHLVFLSNMYQLPKSRIDEVVEIVGIEAYLHKKTRTFSLGMKQLLLIAMAIINEPSYLIMDEPFNGLDPTSILDLKQLIIQMETADVTLLLSSHNLALIQDLTFTVYLLKSATLIPIDLNKTSYQVHRIKLIEPCDITDLLTRLNYPFVHLDDVWEIQGDLTSLINGFVDQGIRIKSLLSSNESLEEVYQGLYINE